MLYEKNKSRKLSDKLFKNPTSEYRATPFWAWNDDLSKDELCWQIEQFKKMGFGGFHMHVRSGLNTPYLSEQFFELISGCVDKAKKEKMLAWLYDEDRWPSGAAGGIVTKNLDYRKKLMVFTPSALEEKTEGTDLINQCGFCKAESPTGGKKTSFAGVKLIASFDVTLGSDGTLCSYKLLEGKQNAEGTRWNVYAAIAGDDGWFNGQAYVDTLMPEAVACFIENTHEKYFKLLGEQFGKTVPAIFTDEPQLNCMQTLAFSAQEKDVEKPWTYGLEKKFYQKYGYDLISKLPELIWNLSGGKPSKARYHFHDLICEIFTTSFCDQCGAWCEAHGLPFTGHVMAEASLGSQTEWLGEAMRTYRGFTFPGIDMLCDNIELTTAKQAQSAVHQYGREAMMSELYGVTGWEFDFRGHKFQGDWQACLGVTIRVPHLSWYSMRGSAKRDYPGAISYQSAWYKDYSYVEDHFARVNTALTRGKPVVNVAVLHPVESYWLENGPSDVTAGVRGQMENDFKSVISWLLRGCIDFDFISEGLLPKQSVAVKKSRLQVGCMSYGAVVIPPITTIRSSTIDALLSFVKAGGQVVFTGACPKNVDAEQSDACKELYELSEKVNFTSLDLMNALKPLREVEIVGENGWQTNNYIYNKRKDGKSQWLFIANIDHPVFEGEIHEENANQGKKVFITVKGEKVAYEYDTLSGEILPAKFHYKNGNTIIEKTLYRFDSLLLRLDEGKGQSIATQKSVSVATKLIFTKPVSFALKEDNVMVLDMAEWSEDGTEYNHTEEMLRIDALLRKRYGYPSADGKDVQPWVIAEQRPEKSVYLRFKINSSVAAKCSLAFEEAESITLNGQSVCVEPNGYYVDKSIKRVGLPGLIKGENVLVVKAPIGKRTSLENMFLLGKFGVSVTGASAQITKLPKTLAFSSITNQGLPFYGAGIEYKLPFTARRRGDVQVLAQKYVGALIKVRLDGKAVGNIVYAPNSLIIKDVAEGEHLLSLELVATRVNTFTALHACSHVHWKGPDFWYKTGAEWSYEYNLKGNGILKSPELNFIEGKQN